MVEVYHPQLQQRDHLTLTPLAFCYRMTTAAIEARRHGVSIATARKRLNRLAKGRFVTRLRAWVSDIPPINSPLASWSPGDPEPDFGAIAYAAQRRWVNRPIRQSTIYIASIKLLSMFALPARPHLKLRQATHDLGVTETFFYCQRHWPNLEFVGEDLFSPERGHGEAVEDAQLVSNGSTIAAVEYAGSYRKHRVKHFHDHVSERQLAYFLF